MRTATSASTTLTGGTFTIAPVAVRPAWPTQKVFASAMILLGSVTGMPPQTTTGAPIQGFVIDAGTIATTNLARVIGHRNDLAGHTSTAARVADLKNRTGLTWAQLATLFGVSRRAVHHWAEGGNLTAANTARLDALCGRVADSGCVTDVETHRWVLSAAQGQSRSRYATWVAELGDRSPEDGRTLEHQLTPNAEPYLAPTGKLLRSRPSKHRLGEP